MAITADDIDCTLSGEGGGPPLKLTIFLRPEVIRWLVSQGIDIAGAASSVITDVYEGKRS